MIKVGCSDFVIATNRYQSRMGLVELTQLQKKSPRTATVEKWRAQAPHSFEFVVCADRDFFPSKGKTIQPSLQILKSLRSKILYLQVPSHWHVTADRMADIQNSLKNLSIRNYLIVWEPPAKWDKGIVERLSHNLQMIPVINPLDKEVFQSFPIQYFKLGGKKLTKGNYTYSDQELNIVLSKSQNKMTYVIFNNGPTSFKDALRFSNLVGTN